MPFEPRWDQPQLNDEELRGASSFEWWYFDLASEDGLSLVAVLSRRNPVLSRRGASIYVELRAAGQGLRRVRNYAASEFEFRETADGFLLRIERHTLRMMRTGQSALRYTLELNLAELQTRLEFEPLHTGFVPGDDGCYFRARADTRRRTCVSFSAPLMRARGTLTLRGEERSVRGRGYHDHPWGTEQLFETHRQWHWGRVSNTELGAMFATVQPASEYEGELRFLYAGRFGSLTPDVSDDVAVQADDWKRDAPWGIRFPHRLTVLGQGRTWTLACTRSLLDTAIYNRSQVSWAASTPDPGRGWVEYYALPGWFRGPAFLGARIAAFFWRPFPFFGR